MIPKTLYLYWGGQNLSWLRFLTVKSFAKHNPDWEIVVYYPFSPTKGTIWTTFEQRTVYKGEDFFTKLAEYAELRPFNMASIGSDNDMTEVHKSDIFRLWILAEHGGLYSDFDILFIKPMPDISKKLRLFCHHPDGHYAVGFLAAKRGDDMYKSLLEKAVSITPAKYQSLGATLWNEYLQSEPDGWNIPATLVYPIGWQHADELFKEELGLPDESIGVHWYAGNSESKFADNSTIGNIVRELT